MPAHKDIKCNITIAGKVAKEYSEPDIDGNQVTVYVIAETGKEFSFVTNFTDMQADRLEWFCFTNGIRQICSTTKKPYTTPFTINEAYPKHTGEMRVMASKLALGHIQSGVFD